MVRAAALAVAFAVAALTALHGSPHAAAGQTDGGRFGSIEDAVAGAIAEGRLPGAVVLVGQGDGTPYVKAFGNRAVTPAPEPMTADTIFDIASLTKVVATATSVMMLVEEGRIRLADRVSTYIPEFGRYGKQDVTVRHLLTHVSGLRPDLDLELEFDGYERAIEMAAEEVLVAAPGERFIYSDINFFLLGEIVARVAGEGLDVFARRRIFEPLQMRDTGFRPSASLRARIAPTQRCAPLAWPCNQPDAPMLRGVVHDPTARRMGGVAGHAGVFSTAADLARFCRMLLRGGELDGVRLFSPLTVAKMTSAASPAGHASRRGLGWDIDSQYSSNRGELFPVGSFGHTGFTGTSLWLDPASSTFVVFLSNRVHPDGRGDVTALRGRVATIAAAAVSAGRIDPAPLAAFLRLPLTGGDFGAAAPPPAAPPPPVLAGIDVLRAEGFSRLKGKRVGLLTNLAARARDGKATLELLAAAPDVRLVSVFSPEHGLAATLDTKVASGRDEKTGVTVHSLYGETERPTPKMLDGLDLVVVDLPDVGVRFYTYATSTLGHMLEEAGKRSLPVIVLDRPNPVNGHDIEGPSLDPGISHPAAYFPMPIRHGLTPGELARVYNAERKFGVDLTIVQAQGWRRDYWFDETGLPWANPSPNMRTLHQAMLYPGIGAFEWSNVSVGRGTDTPFEQIGAPWVDGTRLAAALNGRRIPGIRFYPVRFTPSSSAYANEECSGVFMVVTDRRALRPVRVGVEIAAALQKLHPDRFDFENTVRLLGSQATIDRIRRGDDPAEIAASWAPDEARWRLARAPYLLYR